MKKQLLLVLVLFLSLYSPSFACGCHGGTTSLATSNNQKACKNVVSFIYIDFSFLSPKATAADLNLGCKPKLRGHSWIHKCSTPQCCADECSTDECCPQTCIPQCIPCVPQHPSCNTKSMSPDENQHSIVTKDAEQDGIIPVSYKQKNKANIFRINPFRHLKLQIL